MGDKRAVSTSRTASRAAAAPLQRTAVLELDIVVPRRDFLLEAALVLREGERLALFGPSGAGKTTILETIAGMTSASRATIAIDGRLVTDLGPRAGQRSGPRTGPVLGRWPSSTRANRRRLARAVATGHLVPPGQRSVSYLRQPLALFPHLSVAANLAYGTDRSPAELSALLRRVGLPGGEHLAPSQLSMGQRQRVALAQCLARPYRVLLLDEPFNALDASSRETLVQTVVDAATASKAAAVLVTHDLEEAQAFAAGGPSGHLGPGYLGLIDSGQLLELGDPATVVARPRTRRAAELLGYEGFLRLEASGRDRQDSRERGLLLALHPERVLLGAHEEEIGTGRGTTRVLEARLLAEYPYGPRSALRCEIDGQSLTLYCASAERERTGAAIGDRVPVTLLDPPVVRDE